MSTKTRKRESGLENLLGDFLAVARTHFKDEFIEEHAVLLRGVAEKCGKETRWAYNCLPTDLVPEQAEFLLELAEKCGERTGWAYEFLPKDLVPEQAEFLLELAEKCGERTGWAYEFLPKDLVPEQAEFLLKLAEKCGTETGRAYEFLPKDLVPEQAEFLLELAERCGTGTGWAYGYLPKDLVPEQNKFLLELAERCGTGTGRAYGYLPKYLMPEHTKFLLDLAERCGDRTGLAYESLPRYAKPEQYYILLQMVQTQGIMYLERYLKTNFPLLKCRLETGASKRKPLAVIIHNTNDEKGAFSEYTYITQLRRLLSHYAVYLFETDNRTEAFEQIQRAASYRRKKPRAIDLLILGGHGTPLSLNLGKTPDDDEVDRTSLERYADHYLCVLDGERFARIAPYIRRGGKIVLVSCSTGAKIAGEKNLAQVIRENISHATVYAPKVNTHLKEFDLKRGRLADVRYECGSELTLKLSAGSYKTSEKRSEK